MVTLFVFVEAVRAWTEWMAQGADGALPAVSHSLTNADYASVGLSRGIPFRHRA